MLAGNSLHTVSQCETSFLEVFAFFYLEDVNIISGTWCVGKKHHVGASYQEHANGLCDALAL
jgi:hypothetical protein